jgi:hypothetical protein
MTIQEWKEKKRKLWFFAWIYVVFVIVVVLFVCSGCGTTGQQLTAREIGQNELNAMDRQQTPENAIQQSGLEKRHK